MPDQSKEFPAGLQRYRFLRVAAIAPEVVLAHPAENARRIAQQIRHTVEQGARVVVTPELCITGYTCGDLFRQEALLDAAEQALDDLVGSLGGLSAVWCVGMPLRVQGRLYNVAVVGCGSGILGVVPKTHLAQRGEFYEARWFVSGRMLQNQTIPLLGTGVPFGTDLLFSLCAGSWQAGIGVELCEDLWAVEPPSGKLAIAGAQVILNLSASPEVLGKGEYRRQLVRQQSARCLAAYVYVSAGAGESVADLCYGGHALIAENGCLLAESARFSSGTVRIMADVDVGFLQHERMANASFMENPVVAGMRVVPCDCGGPNDLWKEKSLLRAPVATPFVPQDSGERAERCREIFSIQSFCLAQRLAFTKSRRAVIGLSGGLDSTLAFLVCIEAMKRLGRPASDILAATMPGFGTTQRTKTNAMHLAELAGAELREIPIAGPVRLHLEQIGQPPGLHDITFENAQARERTQLLMDLANREGGIVVGTGDLSESALGWCTYNGDHMSMYHVNSGVPKTLVRYVVAWCAEEVFTGELARTLRDIVATPISPELLPVDEQGESPQQTEDVLGPYELHDFFLYHFCRRGAEPAKILWLAEQAWSGKYERSQIAKCLREFLRRFFAAQFKRNSMPDGPKVGSVALSQRGDWRMPSDAVAAAWLDGQWESGGACDRK